MVTEIPKKEKPPKIPLPEEELPPEIPLEEEEPLLTPEQVVKLPTTETIDGWEFRDIAWNTAGEAINYIVTSPEDEEYTKAEYDVALIQQKELAPQQTQIIESFQKVFPTVEDPMEALVWATESKENLDELQELIFRVGRTEDTVALLKVIYPEATTEDIEGFFGVEAEPTLEEPTIRLEAELRPQIQQELTRIDAMEDLSMEERVQLKDEVSQEYRTMLGITEIHIERIERLTTEGIPIEEYESFPPEQRQALETLVTGKYPWIRMYRETIGGVVHLRSPDPYEGLSPYQKINRMVIDVYKAPFLEIAGVPISLEDIVSLGLLVSFAYIGVTGTYDAFAKRFVNDLRIQRVWHKTDTYKALKPLFETPKGKTLEKDILAIRTLIQAGRIEEATPKMREIFPRLQEIHRGLFPARPTMIAPPPGAPPRPPSTAITLALTGAPKATSTALTRISEAIISQGLTPAQITSAFIASYVPAGVTLEKTTSLITQLEELGHTTEAITAMSPEEAWATLFKAPVAEVIPPITPAVAPELPSAIELRVLHEHPARVEGFRNVTLPQVTNYLVRLKELAQTEKPNEVPAILEAIRAAREGDLGDAGVSADIALSNIHKTYRIAHPEFELKVVPEVVPEVERVAIPEDSPWVSSFAGEKHTAIVNGFPLTIVKQAVDLSGQGLNWRVRTNYTNEMFQHQFYKTLKEAKTAAEKFVKAQPRGRAVSAPPAVPPVKPPVEVTKPSGLTIETTKQDTFTKGAAVSEDASKITEDAITAQSDSANLPPPNIPPGTVGHVGSGGDSSENALYDMVNRIIPDEAAERAAVRIWAGTRKRKAVEVIGWWKKGNQLLREKGIGKPDVNTQRLTKEDSYDLFKSLHGEGDVPAGAQDRYDYAKQRLDKMSSDMLAFDPSFSRAMMAHPDYFPRGWRPPTAEQAGRMRIGAKPGFLKPRVDATFTEMVEGFWEPISWNELDMVALRELSQIEYMEGQILVTRLKTFSKAISARDAPREGWRVPKVGPAFEGKPYVGTDGKAYMTPRIAVPNSTADILESTYGVPVEFRVGGVDIFKAITAFGALTKRVKLFGSLFQHVDFLTRDLVVAFTPEGIRHGLPLKFPSFAARLTASAVSPSYRATLEARILSGEPLYSDSTISLKMVADDGWELGQDELLIRRNVAEGLERVIREAQAEGLEVRWFQRAGQVAIETVDPVTRRINTAAKFFEAGLFDGVYRVSQAWALEYVIIPKLRRLHPTWTDHQISGSAAEEVNKNYSTLAVWQSVLQQPAAREFARAIFFSWNESESWIRQATSAVKGKNARYWREYALATLYTLILVANVINLISERKPLPLDRYVPISLGNSYSSMPWGIAYNPKFLSPRLPWNGRNGQPIYLDIVGQADTYLRWMLDPLGALTARVNVFPRALMNQVNGEDFWGRELEDMDDRVKQALIDLFAPIGAGNLLEVARLQWPPVGEVLPEAEGRIGIVGSLIQVSGLNVRAAQTMDMLDRYAKESGLLKADGTPVESWDDLEPYQKKEFAQNEDLQRELGLRGEAAVERQYPGAEGFAKLGELDQERITRGEALIAELMADLTAPDVDRAMSFDIARAFRNEVTRLKREISDRKAQVDEDFQLFQETGVLPEDPNQRALTEYYNLFEKAKKPSGVIDWDEVNRLEEELREKWTSEQESYVDRNIGLTEWGPLLQEFTDAQKTLSDAGYWDVDERDRKVFRYQHPGVEKVLTGKFYNYKPIEEGAEKITLEWQDVYRQIDDMETGFNEQSDEAINALPPMEGVTREDWLEMPASKKRDLLIDHERELIYAENPRFWEDDQRRDAWNKGFVEGDEDTEGYVDLYLERANIVRTTSPLSAETKLFMLDHPDFFKKGRELGVWTDDGIDWNRPVLEISVEYATDDDWYNEGIPGKHAGVAYKNTAARDAGIAEERSRYLADNPEYNEARYRRDAYGLKDKNFNLFPDELIETYVDYYTNPNLKKPDDWKETSGTDEWYEDDWFLQENPAFHQALVDYGKFTELRDLSKVPTREVFSQYQDYLEVTEDEQFSETQAKLNFRHENPELDKWLVEVRGYKPVGNRWRTFDPELANRKYWLELASHFKNMLKNLGIREDITPEELTNEEMELIKRAIRQLYE